MRYTYQKGKNTNISANYNNSAKVTSAMHSLHHVTLALCVAMLFIKCLTFQVGEPLSF